MESSIRKKNYILRFNTNNGQITGLFDSKNPIANWIGEDSNSTFGIPFINGTYWNENNICSQIDNFDEDSLSISSEYGGLKLKYSFYDERIDIELHTVIDCGPRSGLQMDLNLLDTATNGDWQWQCMPKTIYTDENRKYAYFIFSTSDNRFIAVALDSEFAAWRIKYSYAGHKMTGFQLLNQADDVVTGDKPSLSKVDYLKISLIMGDNVTDCYEKLASVLNLGMVTFNISGGFRKSVIKLTPIGEVDKISLIAPDGRKSDLNSNEIRLEQEGMYQIVTSSPHGKKHYSRVLCHENWESLFDRINRFYKNHFQDGESGAFYRAIWSETLSPADGQTFEGLAFGDVNSLWSCRSGEFGGFAGWAMLKNIDIYGPKDDIFISAEKYILNWVLNRGHEDDPYNSTIYKKPSIFKNRAFGPYHLYREVNYPQHEVFIMEELVDYFRITEDESVLHDLIELATHFIHEHMDSNGMVQCQNDKEGHITDYSTVHVPISGLIKVAVLIKDIYPDKAESILGRAESLADFVCRRGLDFPTEGEACTEDGSMACSVITLLHAYKYIKAKPEYLSMAETILEAHEVLTLKSTDCRTNGSSLRFWETQYETRDWGPSINAGHGWTIWTSEAKALLAVIRNDIDMLRESYEGFVTNICKVHQNGAMPCCFTPDMIPSLPHAPVIWGVNDSADIESVVSEYRQTTSFLAMDYVRKTYASSGNYFLIKAAEIWSKISAYCPIENMAINGVMEDGCFTSGAERFNYLLLSHAPDNRLYVKCRSGIDFTLAFVQGENEIKIKGVSSISSQSNVTTFKTDQNYFELIGS